jgi:hypothetical protein
MKELIAGKPPQSRRLITQVNGLKPMEMPIGGAKPGTGISGLLLNAFTAAFDLIQTDIAQKQVQEASKPIRGDAARLQAVSRLSTQVNLPPQPILPTHPDAGQPSSGAATPTATSARAGGESTGWLAKTARVGTETITVPAGTFECDHYAGESNGKRTDVWVSSKVPWHGLVKLASADSNMELQRVFEHETSMIKDLPKKKK